MFYKGLLRAILWLICAVFLAACSLGGDPIVYDNHGQAVQLSKLQGKWIIVNYWADWCAACRAEIPELNKFHQNSVGKDYVLYGIDYDKLTSQSQDESIRLAGVEFPVLRENPGSAWGMTGIDVIPMTFIINPEGKVVATIRGSNTERSLLDKLHLLKTS